MAKKKQGLDDLVIEAISELGVLRAGLSMMPGTDVNKLLLQHAQNAEAALTRVNRLLGNFGDEGAQLV